MIDTPDDDHLATISLEGWLSLKSELAASQTRVTALEMELGRAYRALCGFYRKIARSEVPTQTMVGYHSPSLAAAMRFVEDGALDGSSYFEGKYFEVIHSYLRQYEPPFPDADNGNGLF